MEDTTHDQYLEAFFKQIDEHRPNNYDDLRPILSSLVLIKDGQETRLVDEAVTLALEMIARLAQKTNTQFDVHDDLFRQYLYVEVSLQYAHFHSKPADPNELIRAFILGRL